MGSSSYFRPTGVSWMVWILAVVSLGGNGAQRARADDPATFFRGINLNGPAVTIDGQRWEGQESKHYDCRDKAFENQNVPLVPATDAERARMIRSSRWSTKNRVELKNLPTGSYTVFLYVWEDNNSETFAIAVNGQEVEPRFESGVAGQWERLGPWFVDVSDGRIVLTSAGGAANFSGMEIWRGRHAGDAAAEPKPEELAFFESRIRPLLIKHCYECHSAAAEELQGDLLVDSRPTLRQGGAGGPAVVPGDPEHSLLIEAVRYENGDMQMPPDQKLTAAEIADLEYWVKIGAPDPRGDSTKQIRAQMDLDRARRFWSFQPLAHPPVPAVRDATWPLNDIDRFILARLEERGLQPLADASKRTWIRRATFDLTGLPPTPAEVDDFLADGSTAACERVVNRLLDSRRYGERWGRHWMDLVRYADTAGDNSDYPVPQAYLYRNYIIDSFNNDKPYDQFLREQIAGDLLPAASDAERNEQIIATGYIAISRRFGSIIQDYPQHLTIEDTIDNIGRTVLGLTITCARCHDHKFDPITQADYYGIYGIFDSTRYPFPGIELDKKPRDLVPLWKDGRPGSELAYAVADAKPHDARLHVRGEPKKPGSVVPRRFLEVLGGQRLAGDDARQSGRRQLAIWLTAEENPLTARVMVNRVWQYHFGRGLVPTPSDFGTRGQPPTHPALLDWLASRFVSSGWSIKQLHRDMMLSRTYRLAARAALDDTSTQVAAVADSRSGGLDPRVVDPDNELHWRHARRRMDAETLRDTMLLLSGELDEQMPRQPHPFPPADKWQYTQHHPFRDCYDSNCRSVYLMTARLNARPFFTTFDGADRNASTALRDSSVTTVQSLYLLNDEFVHARAERFAARMLRDAGDDGQRLVHMFELVLGRPPTADEQAEAAGWLAGVAVELQSSGTPAEQVQQAAWAGFARVMFRLNEFLYIE